MAHSGLQGRHAQTTPPPGSRIEHALFNRHCERWGHVRAISHFGSVPLLFRPCMSPCIPALHPCVPERVLPYVACMLTVPPDSPLATSATCGLHVPGSPGFAPRQFCHMWLACSRFPHRQLAPLGCMSPCAVWCWGELVERLYCFICWVLKNHRRKK